MAYLVGAQRITPGAIVKIERPLSSSGKPTTPHFFVVLTGPEQPNEGDFFFLMGVSSRIDPKSADPARHVSMKWLNRKGGDPETGFTKPCFACADFTHVLPVRSGKTYKVEVEAEYAGKYISPDKLQALVAVMNAYNRRSP